MPKPFLSFLVKSESFNQLSGQWWKLSNGGELQVNQLDMDNEGNPTETGNRNWKYSNKTWIIPDLFEAGFIKTSDNEEILCVMGKGLQNEESLEGTQVVLEKYQDNFVIDKKAQWHLVPYKDNAGNPTEWFRIFEFSQGFSLTSKNSEKLIVEGNNKY